MKSKIFLGSLCGYDEDEEYGSIIIVEPHPFNKSVKSWYKGLHIEYVLIEDKYVHAYSSFFFDHTPYLPPMPVMVDVVKWRADE